ncbi:MAG: restriction endonuclease subunit S [Clostridiales bacterium]|nr:restriction endonuclease subunit S [Clostridiales bacterium]
MRAKLGNIATYINGYAFKPSDWSATGRPIIRIQDLTGNSYQANRFNGEIDRKYDVSDGDVLISWSASLGVYIWHGEDAVLNQHIFKVVFDKAEVNKSFFIYQVENILENAGKETHGATMKHLTKPVFDALPFYLPDMEEQNEIARKLDAVSNLISIRKQQLAKLDELVKARFVEMFGDPVQNEKGWPLVTLGELAEIRIGPFGTLLHKEDYIVGGHALVNPSHIIEGHICVDSKLTVSDEKYQELSAYQLSIGDVVLGRRGEMGRCAVVQEEGLLCGTGSMVIRPNDKMKPYFLQNIISSPTYKKIIEDKAVGVTMMNLNVPIVSSLTIPLLPMDMQERFISFMQQVDQTKSTVQASLDEMETLKKSLMQEYFG